MSKEATLEYLRGIRWIADDIHYKIDKLLSKNKTFNYVISAREAGKSTDIWHYCFNRLAKRGKTTLVIRRQIADITVAYIDDIEELLNKFTSDPVQLFYTFSRDGIITVNIGKQGDKKNSVLFFRVISLAVPMRRFKSLMFPNLGVMFFDEFIVNTRMKEKYLSDEVFRFKELFNTFQREAENLRVIFAGNPYSLYNPYFSWKGFNPKSIYPGVMLTTEDSALEAYELTDELKAYILEKNPLYRFDDAYKAYAFDGRAINDEQVMIEEKQPQNFKLLWVFYTQGKYVGVFGGMKVLSQTECIFYWVSIIEGYNSKRRDVICFDLQNLIAGNILATNETKQRVQNFRRGIEHRTVAYRSIEEGYLTEEIYECVC